MAFKFFESTSSCLGVAAHNFKSFQNPNIFEFSTVKEGSPIWVDRICDLGPKSHNLQGENDSVTPRVLELELSF